MSSTSRGSVREASDYYVTPVSEIVKFLTLWDELPRYGSRIYTLDPCAGGDEFRERMSYPHALAAFGIICDTIDIREDSRAVIKGDYLQLNCKNKYTLIITNPPFALAKEIATKSIDDVLSGGFVVLLLRLNFFGSQKRFQFWQDHPPYAIFIHSQRISFTGGTTDSIEYMHCVWKKGYSSNQVTLRII